MLLSKIKASCPQVSIQPIKASTVSTQHEQEATTGWYTNTTDPKTGLDQSWGSNRTLTVNNQPCSLYNIHTGCSISLFVHSSTHKTYNYHTNNRSVCTESVSARVWEFLMKGRGGGTSYTTIPPHTYKFTVMFTICTITIIKIMYYKMSIILTAVLLAQL